MFYCPSHRFPRFLLPLLPSAFATAMRALQRLRPTVAYIRPRIPEPEPVPIREHGLLVAPILRTGPRGRPRLRRGSGPRPRRRGGTRPAIVPDHDGASRNASALA